MNPPYFIASLPRSGTAWLANFLTFDDSFCLHEALADCENIGDLQARLNRIDSSYKGDSDPNIGLVARELAEAYPDSKYVIVSRPAEECAKSELAALKAEGFGDCQSNDLCQLLERASNGLEWLFKHLPRERRMLVLFENLHREATVSAIWRFLLPQMQFPRCRFQLLRYLRVTQMMRERAEAGAGSPFIKWLAREQSRVA